MDHLRLILLIIGVLIVAGIWSWELFKRRRSRMRRDPDDDLFSEPMDPFEPSIDSSMARSFDASSGEPAGSPGGSLEGAAPGAPRDPFDISMEDLGRVSPGLDEVEEVDTGNLADFNLEPVSPPAPPRGPKTPAPAKPRAPEPPPASGAGPQRDPGEDLIVAFTVMARRGQVFTGPDLRRAFEMVGMRYGDMQIFHHYGVGNQPTAGPVFSAANVLKPGTFEPEAMDDFTTPGLSLFMRLPGEVDGGDAFELLLTTGNRLAGELDGVLCDQSRNVLTAQSINHLRERIAEFARRQMLRTH